MSDHAITNSDQPHFERFCHELRERGRSSNTLRAYRLDWQQFSNWYAHANGEPFTLERLTALDIQDYLRWGKQQGLKPSTLNRRLGFLKQYAAWAETAGLMSAEQRKRIQKIGIVRKQQLAPQALTAPQVRRLLKEVEVRGNLRDRAIIMTLLYTGLRVGELVALTRADIVLSERKGVIAIRAEIAKGGKERLVPVPKDAREALALYMAQSENGECLFMGRQGPLTTAGVAAMVEKYAAWAKLDGVTPHVLRHTFAYNYLAHNQNDLVALADILGHTDLNTTQIYTRRQLSDLQEGVEQVRFF
jgi:site-specific recombinase XerD